MGIVDRIRDRWRVGALAIACLGGALVGIGDAGAGAERALRAVAWQLRERDASGDLVVVEIDARSIAAIRQWPWPRGNHARLIDRLRAAGAATIAFDVDFSARSEPAEDRALAGALARAGGRTLLPTFRQQAGGGTSGWTDSLPIPELRDHAQLAAVSVLPDPDGYVRRAPVGTITDGTPRPSLSAAIAGANGAAGSDFAIDYAIRPGSIPRLSFIDVRDGRVPRDRIAGRQVLVGATAIEMGDRYAVPNWGVIPGVVIQALAAETLRRGVPMEAGWPIPWLVAAAFAAGILLARSRRVLAAAIAAAPVALFLAAVGGAAIGWLFPIVPALVVTTVASVTALLMRILAAARRRRAHDPETGLPNRLALRDAVRSYGGAGIVAARIGEFERLSAGIGAAGTVELIGRVRDRIALVAEGETIYRVDDRVLAWRCYDESGLEDRVRALRATMLNPVEVRGRRVDVTLSLGFAPEGTARDRAVAQAILAAEQAQGAGGWRIHDAREDETLDRELSLLGELDEAIDRGQISVFYQPKLDIATNRIVSVEALVRWHHPDRGFLGPDLFIPLAERNDRIDRLTLHVVEQAIRDVLDWEAAGFVISAAVNLSAKLLSSGGFVDDLRALVERGGLAPSRLTFEVTESATLDDPERAAAALRSFSALGIGISMDDYGTGQSTLSYIKDLPLTELKIDRSFVQHAHLNRGDGVLVRSTVELAHELGLKVVAEGVEDAACLAFLRETTCDLAQGYFISKPLPAADLLSLVTGWVLRTAA